MKKIIMKETKIKELQKWVKTWEQAESALKSVKIGELSANDYYLQNRMLLNEMLQYAFEHREIRLSSGLVEQQKLFKKFHQQMDKSNV